MENDYSDCKNYEVTLLDMASYAIMSVVELERKEADDGESEMD
jgi:hypothetical protein